MSELVQAIILKAKHVQKICRYVYFSNVDKQIQIVYARHHLFFSI
jgi:hypothetical protein